MLILLSVSWHQLFIKWLLRGLPGEHGINSIVKMKEHEMSRIYNWSFQKLQFGPPIFQITSKSNTAVDVPVPENHYYYY